ncbi:Protein rolling stone [Eumeta japonica]|uniref:Protein rolling stone n=1 Tax=Eumeta variegata TaxID=151549 RepID=A0A4C1VVA6_EUMVA|nr:Protein rolling stone [Eumeta japonica]
MEYKITPSDNEENDHYEARNPTPRLCRVYWAAHTIATDLAFVITAVYWSLVHDPQIHNVNALNLLVHGGNSLVMLSELMMTAHPMRAAHALYGVGAGLVYGVFSAIYWAAGGTDRLGNSAIYQALDWNKPGKAVGFVAMCAIVLCCAHALATSLTLLRARLALWLASRRSSGLPVENFPPLTTY